MSLCSWIQWRVRVRVFSQWLCREQITEIFMWALSSPIWVEPQPFQKGASSEHKAWNIMSFHLFWLFCLGASLQMYTVLFLHSQPLCKQNIFYSQLFLCLYASFSLSYTWISWKNVTDMKVLFRGPLKLSHHTPSSRLLLHLHLFHPHSSTEPSFFPPHC